ncbi:MAG: OsmC family protein [Pseudomonadota bacterium]
MEKEYHYQAEVRWTGDKKGDLHLEGKPVLGVTTPPEFGGHEGLTTPEDLFVAAAVVCLMSTFLAMGKKVKASWNEFACRGDGKLELVPDQGLLFTRIDLFPKVAISDERDRPAVEKALDLARRYCLVTNSMKTEIAMHPEITVR